MGTILSEPFNHHFSYSIKTLKTTKVKMKALGLMLKIYWDSYKSYGIQEVKVFLRKIKKSSTYSNSSHSCDYFYPTRRPWNVQRPDILEKEKERRKISIRTLKCETMLTNRSQWNRKRGSQSGSSNNEDPVMIRCRLNEIQTVYFGLRISNIFIRVFHLKNKTCIIRDTFNLSS